MPAAQVKRATVARVRRRTQSRTSLDDDSSSEARVTSGRTETIILATRDAAPRRRDSGEDRLHAARGQTAGLRRRTSTPSGQTDLRKSAGSTQSVLSLGAALWSRIDSSQQERLEQADRREAQSERTSKLERGHREAAQMQELRDTLSDGTPEQQALNHRDAEHEPHPGSKSRTSRPDTWVTLDEKDDPSLQRMRGLILGERRGPGSNTCWDTRNSKNHGATCSSTANSWLISRVRTTRTRERLVGKTEMTILRVRLETAGETTILYKLTLGEVDTTTRAIGFMMSEPARRFQRGDVEYKNIEQHAKLAQGRVTVSRMCRSGVTLSARRASTTNSMRRSRRSARKQQR